MNPYQKDARQYAQSTKDLDLSNIYKKFLKYKKKGKLLDLGCGSGRDSLFFKKQGFEVTSSDGFQEMCDEASKILQQKVICLDFRDISFNNEFDAVWACASLLHLKKSELNMVLNKIAQAMKKDAIFYCSFKYGDKEIIKNKLNYNFENENSFQERINTIASLEIIESFKTKDTLSDDRPNWFNVIIKKIST